MENAIISVYKTQLKAAINDWGTDVTVFYYTTSQPSVAWDPINNEPINVTTAEVNPDGWVRAEQKLVFPAAAQSFADAMSAIEQKFKPREIVPDADIRLTFWLEDVLINHHSSTGSTYLDNCDKMKVYNKFYQPKHRHRTGIDSTPYVYIVTGDEIKG